MEFIDIPQILDYFIDPKVERLDFSAYINGKQYQVSAYKVGGVIRLDIKPKMIIRR